MSITITTSEILDALAAASAGSAPEDARTVQEMMADSGASINRVRAALKALQAQGRLQVHRVRRMALDGRNALVAAYTITPVKRKR